MSDKECTIWWCHKPLYAQGYCNAHYIANKRFGSPYGKEPQGQQEIDQVIEMAKKVSRAILENEGLLEDECSFCHEYNYAHKPDCPTMDATLIIARTS